MEARHHLLELLHTAHRVRQITRVGSEEGDGVVAPVIREPFVEQVPIVQEHMDRHKLDRRHAERLDVLDDLRRCQPRERTAMPLRDTRMQPRIAAHVHLIDDGPRGRHSRRRLPVPIETGIDDDGLRHEGCAVALVEREIFVGVADRVAEAGGVPNHAADQLARVRIEQQLVRVEAMPLLGLVGAVHAIPVDEARHSAFEIAVPGLVRVFRQHDALELALAAGVEKAQLDGRCVGREQREVDAVAVPCRAAQVRQTFAKFVV